MSFNLSSKMKGCTCGNCVCMRGNDVKEFIRLLKEGAYKDWKAGLLGIGAYYRELEKINKLAGEALI